MDLTTFVFVFLLYALIISSKQLFALRRAVARPAPRGVKLPPAISSPGGAFHLFLRVITFRLHFRNKEEEMGTFSATDYNPNKALRQRVYPKWAIRIYTFLR